MQHVPVRWNLSIVIPFRELTVPACPGHSCISFRYKDCMFRALYSSYRMQEANQFAKERCSKFGICTWESTRRNDLTIHTVPCLALFSQHQHISIDEGLDSLACCTACKSKGCHCKTLTSASQTRTLIFHQPHTTVMHLSKGNGAWLKDQPSTLHLTVVAWQQSPWGNFRTSNQWPEGPGAPSPLFIMAGTSKTWVYGSKLPQRPLLP